MKDVLRLIVYTTLLNAPFWILEHKLFLSRALIGLDSLFALLVLQRSFLLGLICVFLFWLLDLIVSLSLTYHFSSPLEFIRSFRFVASISISDYLTLANGLVALPFVASAALLTAYRRAKVGVVPVVLLVACLILIDITNGSSVLSIRGVRLVSTNIAGSSVYAILKASAEHKEEEGLTRVAEKMGGVTEAAFLFPEVFSAQHGVLYVVVESFGMHKNANVTRWLQQQLGTEKVLERYQLRAAQVPATGGTTAGELRRLCGLIGSTNALNQENSQSCLPNVLAKQGWSTYGYHGFSEKMFARTLWWPIVGIQRMNFAEQLSSRFETRCGGAFQGICDADLVLSATNSLNGAKRFVYVLTLNSHLPLPPIEPPLELANLCDREKIENEVCALLAHVSLVLSAISRNIQSLESRPVVVVVGDHSPPFVNRLSRDQFLQSSVPLFVLVPRGDAAVKDLKVGEGSVGF